jgi:RimJ/RimL family protein N-acetyltransferase
VKIAIGASAYDEDGVEFVRAIQSHAVDRFGPAAFRVTVAAFNERELRVCEKLGYTPVHRFRSTGTPPLDFVELTVTA